MPRKLRNVVLYVVLVAVLVGLLWWWSASITDPLWQATAKAAIISFAATTIITPLIIALFDHLFRKRMIDRTRTDQD